LQATTIGERLAKSPWKSFGNVSLKFGWIYNAKIPSIMSRFTFSTMMAIPVFCTPVSIA
jgi:hypothetical protein